MSPQNSSAPQFLLEPVQFGIFLVSQNLLSPLLVLRLMDPLEAEISCIWTGRKERNHEKKSGQSQRKDFFFPPTQFSNDFLILFFFFFSSFDHIQNMLPLFSNLAGIILSR